MVHSQARGAGGECTGRSRDAGAVRLRPGRRRHRLTQRPQPGSVSGRIGGAEAGRKRPDAGTRPLPSERHRAQADAGEPPPSACRADGPHAGKRRGQRDYGQVGKSQRPISAHFGDAGAGGCALLPTHCRRSKHRPLRAPTYRGQGGLIRKHRSTADQANKGYIQSGIHIVNAGIC